MAVVPSLSRGTDFLLVKQPDGTFLRTFPHGERVSYNQKGLVTSKTTPDGKTITFVYDSKDRITQWVLPDNSHFIFNYDLRGYLKEVSDPAGRSTNFSVSSDVQLTQIQDPQGQNRVYAYDAQDLLIKETDQENKEHRYVYANSGLLAQEIYPDGGTRTITPRQGLVLLTDLPAGVGTKDNPAPIPRTDAAFGEDKSIEGRSWKFVTDRFGNPTISKDGLNRTTNITRDLNGLPTVIQLPFGTASQMTYTSFGEVSNFRDQNGGTTQFAYDPVFKKISQITNAMNHKTNLAYDSQGNLTEIKDNLNQATKIDYLSLGRVDKITDAKGNITKFEYNAAGLVSARIDAANYRTEYVYNSSGMQTQIKDSLNRLTSFSYDSLNRLTQITDPDGKTTTMSYSGTGDLLSIEDAKGQKTVYTYNDRHWVTSARNALGLTENYFYDRDGLLTKKVRRDGSEVVYQYDNAKQLVKKTTATEVVDFGYDQNGNLNSIRDPDRAISRSFGLANQMSSENQDVFSVTYNYNSLRQKTGFQAPAQTQDFFYNSVDVMDEIRSTISGQNFTWTRTHDELNRPVTDLLPNGVSTNRTYTALSQLQGLSNLYPSQDVLSDFTYQYDSVGRRQSKAETSGSYGPTGLLQVAHGLSNYAYDSLDRLVASTEPHEAFSYDFVGNRVFAAGTQYNVANQLLTDGAKYSFEYTANGEIKKRFDLQTGERWDFEWGGDGELLKVQIFGLGGVLQKEITFGYDGLGRRVRKAVNDVTNPAKSYVRQFFYDGQNVIQETAASSVNLVATYMHGPGVDEPLLVSRSEGVFAYTRDGLGSIREMTKPNGTLTQRYRYSAYGVTTHELDENRNDQNFIENRYGFTGRELEDDTGLYYYRARYYDPELGRFISEDPIGFAGGDVNFFSYTWNDPINWIDPTGLKVGDWWDLPANYGRSREIANEEYANWTGNHNNWGDGMRHYEWSRRTTAETNSFTAFTAGWGHEFESFFRRGTMPASQYLRESWMDVHNNALGRDSGRNGSLMCPSNLSTQPVSGGY